MPDLDELIRDHLERRARPAAANPELFHAIDRRRARRSVTRRMGAAGVAIAALAGTALLFVILGHTGGVSPATRSATPPAGPLDVALIVSVVYENSRGSIWAGPLQLTPTGSGDFAPSVDPSGSLVAFTRQILRPGGGSGLFTVPFSGVPAGPCPTCGFKAHRILDPSWFAADPAWSPDGTEIAFAGGGRSRATGIYVEPAAGGTPKLIYATKTDLETVRHPSWSPDGSKIVFAGANGALSVPPNFDLYIVDIAAATSHRPNSVVDITPGGHRSQFAPAWSPDGRLIAFSLQTSGYSQAFEPQATGVIATVSPDGSGLRALTQTTPNLDSDPAWSPDGSFLAFDQATMAGAGYGIFYMRSTGSTPTYVRPGTDPSWSPVPQAAASGSPVGSVLIPGANQPVCNVSSALGRFTPNGPVVSAYFFTQTNHPSCPAADYSSPYYLALTVPGAGSSQSITVSGPFSDCRQGCRIFAAPSFDGGGTSYLAIELIAGNPVVFELYRASESGVFSPVTERGNFTSFPWGRQGLSKGGVRCLSPSSIDVWWALKGPGAWHLTETFARLRGSEMIVTRKTRSVLSPGARLPAGGGSSFCGSPVTP